MKLFTLLGAGALAAGGVVAAAPASAQHYRHGGYQRHYSHAAYGYRAGYGHAYRERGYGWDRGRHYGYARGRHWGGYRHCRVHRGYYGHRCY